MDRNEPKLTLYELTHVSLLLPDPETWPDDSYELAYHYDIQNTINLPFIRVRLGSRNVWIFTGNVILPIGLYSIEFAE